MFLSNHVITGAVIALGVKDPVVAAPLAFASHFALDSIPHFGFRDKTIGFKSPRGFALGLTDGLVSLAIYSYLISNYPQHFWLITVGMFFAALPDLFYIPDILFNKRFDPKFMQRFHKKIQIELPRGILVEIIWLLAVNIPLLKKFL